MQIGRGGPGHELQGEALGATGVSTSVGTIPEEAREVLKLFFFHRHGLISGQSTGFQGLGCQIISFNSR